MTEHMDSITRDIPVKFVLWINFGTENTRQLPFLTVLHSINYVHISYTVYG
jgi:hypothetical protein